jgi:hypothetical protein
LNNNAVNVNVSICCLQVEFESPEFDPQIHGRMYLTTLSLYANTLDETGDFVNAETVSIASK